MSRIEILTGADLRTMRDACLLAARTLEMIGAHIQPGITTLDIDRLVHDFTVAHDAYPSPLNYRGFPKSVCTSLNEVVCHGIPEARVLKDGDIINVDVTSMLPKVKGFHGDTSATFFVGEPSPVAKHVVEVARGALEVGIAAVKPDRTTRDIGAAIQEYVESKGCSVVRDYTGHGIGRTFHSAPTILHYRGHDRGERLRPGMIFTIEPMVNLGGWEVDLLADGWTVVTRDRSLSAQFEHTVRVTKSGVEVLTRRSVPLVNCEDRPWVKVGPLSGPAPARDSVEA